MFDELFGEEHNRNYLQDYRACKQKSGEEKHTCVWDVLNKMTQMQDVIQLDMQPHIQSGFEGLEAINQANAIILHISRNQGMREDTSYLDEKKKNLPLFIDAVKRLQN
jgi:hypothetical protein